MIEKGRNSPHSTQVQSSVLGIATAVPDFCVQPDEYITFMTDLLELTPDKLAIISRFVDRAEIQKRYTVLQDFVKPRSAWQMFDKNSPSPLPSTQQRNEIYKLYVPILAAHVAKNLLNQWGGDRRKITHVIFVSCTGLVAPGIEFFLVNHLGLEPTTQRIGLNFMGCFGAFRALALADAIALQNPSHRILIVCTELCSLHVQGDMQLDTIIGNALFADGAAAFLVGSQPKNDEHAWWDIVRCASYALQDCSDAMRWDIGDQGFVMRLSSEIPGHLRSKIKEFVSTLIGSECAFDDLDWAIHPGGKAIINAIEGACGIGQDQTFSSWHVLKNFGNMSSASIGFVLEHLHTHQKNTMTVALGFGPGLSVEGVLLKNVEQA